MKYFVWLLRAALFIVLLGFAVKNSSMVTLRFFFDVAWTLPLVTVMLIFFAAGAVVGLTAALGTFFGSVVKSPGSGGSLASGHAR